MSQSASDVRVYNDGGVWVAPLGTDMPPDSTSPWPSAYAELGFLSEDGVTETWDQSQEDIKAWQRGTVVRTVTTETKVSFQFAALQTTMMTLGLYYPGSEFDTSDPTTTVLKVKPPTADPRTFGLDALDADKRVRIYVPNGEVTEKGDIVFKNNEATAYEYTVTCYPDLDGVVMYKLSDDEAWRKS